jgi:hypothetical protein
MVMSVLATWAWLMIGQAQSPAPAPAAASTSSFLKGLEGKWVVDGAVGSDADITVAITREGNVVVLRAVLAQSTWVTRYDVSGADVVNREATFRTRIEGQKMVTEINSSQAPLTIETRYLESADRMVTELVRPPSGQPFNRTVLRRK